MKPYYYINAFLDISSLLPTTPNTTFKLLCTFNKENNLNYLSLIDTKEYTGYHLIDSRATVSQVTLYSNPRINQIEYINNVEFDNISVWLTPWSDDFPNLDILTMDITAANLVSSTIASDGTYAYFGTSVSPFSSIVKINIYTFRRELIFNLDTSELYATSLCISPDNKYIYTGTYSDPTRVIKIDANTMTRLNTFEMSQRESDLYTSIRIGNHLYIGTYTYPGLVIKVNLDTFTPVATIKLAQGNNAVTCLIDAGSYLIACLATSPGRIVRIRLSTFTVIDTFTLDAGDVDLACGFVYSSSYLYIGTRTNPAKIIRIFIPTDPLEMYIVNKLTLPAGEINLSVAILTNGVYGYFATYTAPVKIIKILLTTNVRDSAITLNSGENNASSGVISPDFTTVYIGTSPLSAAAQVVKINLSSFSRTGAITLNANEQYATSASIDPSNTFVYFTMGTTPGRIVKISTATFTRVDAITLTDEDTLILGQLYNNKLYVIPYPFVGGAVGRIVEINLSTFTRTNTLYMNPGETQANTALISPSGEYVYISTFPARITSVRTSDMTRYQSNTLITNEEVTILCGAITSDGLYAYYGTETSPARIIKVGLTSSLSVIDTLVLNTGENIASSIVLSPDGLYAYVGMLTSPGKIVKINLSSFTRVGSITLETGENNLRSAVIDRLGNYAYFGCYTPLGQIVKINLYSFSRESSVIVENGLYNVRTAVISNDDTMYFGSYGSPTILSITPAYFSYTLISGLSGTQPGDVINTTTNVQVDNVSQVLRRISNNQSPESRFLRLTVEGTTGDSIIDAPIVIHTQLKIFPN